jgi:hypothetical protein
MPINVELSKIKKEFEELVRNGILNEGFIVNCFYFSIPEEIENFFYIVADDIYIMHIALNVYLSKKEKAEFFIEYIKNRPIEKYLELVKYLEEIEEVKYKKFPRSFLYFNMHFLISQLSDTSKRIIRANRNLFTEYREDSLYISPYLEVKRFKFDFDYYGNIL